MELRHLRYLVAIADAGAFVRAAERLRVAQPALTRQMHDLEKELGATLFEPGARRATLTAAGNACVRLARHVIQDTEQAVTRTRLANSGVIGRCVLATGPVPLASGLVAAFLARMRTRFPGISIVVVERTGREQWAALERAEVDVGIGVEPTETFASLSIATQYLHAIDHIAVAPTHALAQRGAVTVADLLEAPCLTLETGYALALDRVVTAAEAAMREQGLPVETLKRREFSTVESMVAHVRAGQGWTLVSSTMAPLLGGIALVKVSGFHAVLPTVRIWRRTESRPVVLTVLDQLRRFQENRGADPTEGVTRLEPEPDVVPPRIELRHLRSFLAVAEHGSLGRAAESIGVTQPALSRQMRELEYDVGVTLFNRESRGMEVTAAGESFRDDVSDVLSVVDKIAQEIHRAERGQKQRCVIGVVPHPAVDAIVPHVVADLEARGERVRVGTRAIMSIDQAKALHAGEIDISLSFAFPVPKTPVHGAHMTTVQVIDDRISVALLPEGHPLAGRPVLHGSELGAMPFVWMRRDFYPAFYDVVLARLAAAGVSPRSGGEFEGLTTMMSVVRQGGGWTLGWQSHRHEPPAGLAAVPIADFSLPWGVVMTYRQDEARVPVLATIDALVLHASKWSPVKAPELALPARLVPDAPVA